MSMSALGKCLRNNPVLSVLSVVAVAVTFLAYASQIINLFYLIGAPAYDAGWFAYLLSRFDFPPANPLYIQERGIPSFFAFHVAPVMPIWGAMAGALGLSPGVSFAVFQGVVHALLFLAGMWTAGDRLPAPWNGLWRLFVGFALAFSPIALDAIRFPHHELAFAPLFLISCIVWSKGYVKLAAVAFVLSLAVRTDAGFHASCFLLAFAAAEFLTQRRFTPPARIAAALGVVSFLYSVSAFALVHFGFPEFSNFRFSYSGQRFDHLTLEFYSGRVVTLLELRPELFVIFLLPIGVGILKRDLTVVVGALAVLPWVALNLAAVRDIPGQLYTYYAFPFLIVVAWPWLVPLMRGDADGAGGRTAEWRGIACFAVLSVVAWVLYFLTPFSELRPNASPRAISVGFFVPRLNLMQADKVAEFSGRYESLIEGGKHHVLIDAALLSLIPSASRADLVPESLEPPRAYVLAYFETFEHIRVVEESRYKREAVECYEVVDTNVRLVGRNTADLVRSEFGDLVVGRDCRSL